MSAINLADELIRAGIQVREKGKNTSSKFVNICCPFCDDKKFHCGINRDEYWFNCWVCSKGGSIQTLNHHLGGTLTNIVMQIGSKHYFVDNEGVKLANQVDTDILCANFLDYDDFCSYKGLFDFLNGDVISCDEQIGRYIEPSVIKQLIYLGMLKRGVNKLDGYLVFSDGVNYVARNTYTCATTCYSHKWHEYSESGNFIYGESLVRRTRPKVGYITEGVFDCIRFPLGSAIAVAGVPSVSLVLSKICSIFSDADELWLAIDSDVHSNHKRKVASLQLELRSLGYEVKIPDWSNTPRAKDPDEVYRFYGGEVFSSMFLL